MPKTTRRGDPKLSEMPGTLRRSDEHARRIFAEAHDSAVAQYGSEQRAHRVAYAALKHSYEKVGDHWEQKARKGPSDERAEHGGPDAAGRTAAGVDANASKRHLLDIAARLDITGRSRMTKKELVESIERANERARRRH
ncbi:ChaB family protein [Nocardia sp. NPDC004568]|uniref:ChaB family protein n=1 Tax=Nocardia sp. NPDC004568 TaxID=3154551 RepID=UPI0033A95182